MTKSVFTKKYERFKEMLIEARKDAKLTQEELAIKLKCPQSFISKYESGERRLDVVEFLDIARAIGFNPYDFLRHLDKR